MYIKTWQHAAPSTYIVAALWHPVERMGRPQALGGGVLSGAQDYAVRIEKRQKRAARMQKEAGQEDCKRRGQPRRSVACERFLRRQRDNLFRKQMDKQLLDKALNIFTAGA